MSLTPGSRIGPYEIVALLGAGGMGEVYEARDTRLHRDVAIKTLPDAFLTDRERISRFERDDWRGGRSRRGLQIRYAASHP